jgi:hypothetical protein
MGNMRCPAARICRVAFLVATAATLLLAVGATPVAAITTPVAGAPCGADDLGRRAPEVATFKVEPVITHFLAVHVANGTNTEQEYTLQVTDTVTTEVTKEARIETDFINLAIFKIKGEAKIIVKNINTHTEVSTTRMLWRFLTPGYYGLYDGVLKVTGTLDSLHCTAVTDPDGTTSLRWVARTAGTVTTFGADETGSIRCEDRYPASSVRDGARSMLCGTATSVADPAAAAAATNAAMRARGERALAAARAAVAAGAAAGDTSVAAAAPLPSTMTCDPGFSRLRTADRQLAVAVDGAPATAVSLRAPDAGPVTEWQTCHTTADFPQYVLISRQSVESGLPQCLDLADSGVVERAPLKISSCTYRAAQRFTLYRDPASGGVGIQSVSTASMLAPVEAEPLEGDGVAQFSTGRDDGLSTFYQEQVQ